MTRKIKDKIIEKRKDNKGKDNEHSKTSDEIPRKQKFKTLDAVLDESSYKDASLQEIKVISHFNFIKISFIYNHMWTEHGLTFSESL